MMRGQVGLIRSVPERMKCMALFRHAPQIDGLAGGPALLRFLTMTKACETEGSLLTTWVRSEVELIRTGRRSLERKRDVSSKSANSGNNRRLS